ncbi:MAG: hypothetical protein HOE48_22155 [Candidatus Latescibacteria bacterium]|jgi:tetratricopeptide (TPR) repeat protein|nr:hypothetical protein [Candidatus Latescibacterota bacterium]
MKARYLLGVIVCGFLVACSPNKTTEQQAERLLTTARDLEMELEDLPKAITRYAEIVAKFPDTKAAKKAEGRQAQLVKAQSMLTGTLPEDQDSLVAFYEQTASVAPGYFALLKKLGIIYSNQTHFSAPSAVKTRFVNMKDYTVEVWEAQDKLWQTYAFRPQPADRLWQDNLCRQAVDVAEMLIRPEFSDYDRASDVIQRGLHYGNSEDVRSKAKVVAAFCAFRKAKKENLQEGIKLAKEALGYEFLEDEDRVRAYHVIGLCYTYLHQDSGEMADLDAAIKALNECVNIDSGRSDVRELLKSLRQTREKLPS